MSVATATPLRLAGDRKCPVIAYRVDWDLLASVPGFKHLLAEVFIAETGGDMKQFPTARQSASWAGVCPGSPTSPQVESTPPRPDPRTVTSRADLGVVALNKARTNKTRFSAKYHCATNDRVAREHDCIVGAGLADRRPARSISWSRPSRCRSRFEVLLDADRSLNREPIRQMVMTRSCQANSRNARLSAVTSAFVHVKAFVRR